MKGVVFKRFLGILRTRVVRLLPVATLVPGLRRGRSSPQSALSDGDAALVNPRRRSLRVGLHHLRCWPAGNGRRNCAAASQPSAHGQPPSRTLLHVSSHAPSFRCGLPTVMTVPALATRGSPGSRLRSMCIPRVPSGPTSRTIRGSSEPREAKLTTRWRGRWRRSLSASYRK